MRELEFIELQEISLQEVISYSKLADSKIITILDELTASQFNYVVAYADLLKLVYFIIKDTKKLAFIGNVYLAKKIAKNIQVKCQVIHLHQFDSENVLKQNLIRKQSTETYIVKAYDKFGNRTASFIDTNVAPIPCTNLSKYDFQDLKYTIIPRHSKNEKVDIQKIRKLRKEYLNSQAV